MPNIQTSITIRFVLCGILVLGLIAVWRFGSERASEDVDVAHNAENPSSQQSYDHHPKASVTNTVTLLIQNSINQLTEESDKSTSFGTVGLQKDIRSRIISLSRGEVVPAILEYLESGEDARTGTGFVVGSGGFLTEAPTIRTFLLDILASLDPQTTAVYSDKIFAQARNADEWALAMRNIGRYHQDSTTALTLLDKFKEMIGHSSWRKNPTGGFLEAFDIPVYSNDRSALLAILAIARDEDPGPVLNAATIALEKLIIVRPNDSVLAKELLQSDLRARSLSLVDIGEPHAQTTISNYLTDLTIPDEEVAKFCQTFPRHDFSIAHNLLTEPAHYTRSISECARIDLAASDIIERIAVKIPDGSPRSTMVLELRQRIAIRVASIRRAIEEGSLNLNSP